MYIYYIKTINNYNILKFIRKVKHIKMSITAKYLSKSGVKGKDLDGIVREQLLIIDDKLQKADRTWGRNIVSQDLPTTFTLSGLEKKSAQLIIYTAIVRSLKERGFYVRLLLEEHRTTIFIEWVTDLNGEEIKAMNNLISSVRISSRELDNFLKIDKTTHKNKK